MCSCYIRLKKYHDFCVTSIKGRDVAVKLTLFFQLYWFTGKSHKLKIISDNIAEGRSSVEKKYKYKLATLKLN